MFTNHFYDTILLWAFNYNLDGKEDLLYWRNYCPFSMNFIKKSYSNIAHNRKVVQHLIFNKDFAHSVIYTLTLIESYLNIILKTTMQAKR
jgi:hypothetical protein